MIDFSHLESYRENNRIEAKKSLGGFPQSFWETYSAFANTLGGIILLGVEELKDHSLRAVNLPDPDSLLNELWSTLNNPEKVSVNILTSKHVAVETVGGKRIIVITVPRAKRYDKPVYIGGNALGGTYRRCGEGDYRCTAEEIEAMLRDAAVKTPDMRVLDGFGLDAFNFDSIKSYRARMKICRPKHVWEGLENDSFLQKLGAVDCGADGLLHPTAAGLLMFGKHSEILKEHPDFSVSYINFSGGNLPEKCNWCGNISDFFNFAHKKLSQNIVVPLGSKGGAVIDVAPVERALREALANCLINADYYGKGGIEIVNGNGSYSFSNAGSFRIDAANAKLGGVSDPRNGALTKMFNLIDVGSGLGSGLPQIYAFWERQGWLTPEISESFNPDRITLTLSVGKNGVSPAANAGADLLARQALIIDYLTDHADGTSADLVRLLNLPTDKVEEIITALVDADIISRGKGGVLRLKR